MRSRIRSRARALREPFGKAGLTVAIIALVFAMVGGAFAAAGLNGKQKKEVKKIAKKFAGKPGPAGAQGAPGAPGANGTNGSDGANGSNGAPGANGKSVVAADINVGEEACGELGGAEFEVQGSGEQSFACNGAEGAEGPPGPITGTLPSGVTLKGAWIVLPGAPRTAISYGLSLPSAPTTHYIKHEESAPAGCTGGSATEPKADKGHLCVYAGGEEEIFFGAIFAAFGFDPKSGMVMVFGVGPEGFALGSWAVTAP